MVTRYDYTRSRRIMYRHNPVSASHCANDGCPFYIISFHFARRKTYGFLMRLTDSDWDALLPALLQHIHGVFSRYYFLLSLGHSAGGCL